MQKIIDFILEHGNVHQIYSVKRDILGENIFSPAMTELQQKILQSREVGRMLKQQDERGWFGTELHGVPGKAMDATCVYLRELGVEPYHDFMQKARGCLLSGLLDMDKHLGFDRGYSYSKAVALAALQPESDETPELLENAYARIMEIFETSLSVEGLDEVSRICTDKKRAGSRVFLQNCFLPWVCDLAVLAQCPKWKNPRSCETADEAMKNIDRLLPINILYEPFKGRYLGTIGNYLSLNSENPFDLPGGDIVWWIKHMKNICKITDARQIPAFKRQLDYVMEKVEEDRIEGLFSREAQRAFDNFYGFGVTRKSAQQIAADVYFQFVGMIN